MFARELQTNFSGQATSAIVGSVAQTFTAAGTTQATATAIAAVTTFITTATEGQGAILPASMNSGDQATVGNATTVSVYVYPPTGGKINNATANIPMMIAPSTAVTFVCVDGTNWLANR